MPFFSMVPYFGPNALLVSKSKLSRYFLWSDWGNFSQSPIESAFALNQMLWDIMKVVALLVWWHMQGEHFHAKTQQELLLFALDDAKVIEGTFWRQKSEKSVCRCELKVLKLHSRLSMNSIHHNIAYQLCYNFWLWENFMLSDNPRWISLTFKEVSLSKTKVEERDWHTQTDILNPFLNRLLLTWSHISSKKPTVSGTRS